MARRLRVNTAEAVVFVLIGGGRNSEVTFRMSTTKKPRVGADMRTNTQKNVLLLAATPIRMPKQNHRSHRGIYQMHGR